MKISNIQLLSNDQFKNAANKLKSFKSYPDKIEYIFSLVNPSAEGLELLLRPIKKTINGEEFHLGLAINDEQAANDIANAIIDKLTMVYYQQERNSLDNRIEKCPSIDDVSDLINEEIDAIEDEVLSSRKSEHPKKLFAHGYSEQKTYKNHYFFLPPLVSNETLPSHNFSISHFIWLAMGRKACLVEKDLRKLLKDLHSSNSNFNKKGNGKVDALSGRSNNDILQAQDALSLLDPPFVSLFLEAEKKATNKTLTFKTAIRCAAFCELLYDVKKYISHTKTRQKTMVSFAKYRYELDISKALATSKKAEREKYKSKTVKKMPALNRCF